MVKKITVNTLRKYKESNEKFSVLTAYDYSTAKYIDEAGIDVVLIGDSLAMVALGYETTNAIGVEVNEYPATPDVILKAIKSKEDK